MGRQLHFYMSREDEDEFVDFVRSTGDVIIVPQTSERGVEDAVDHFYDMAGYKYGEQAYMWNRSVSPEPILKHYPEQGYYCVDFLESEVINVTRSTETQEGLTAGRLHVEDRFLRGDGAMEKKRQEFLSWYNDLTKWIRKRYRKLEDGTLLGPHAESDDLKLL